MADYVVSLSPTIPPWRERLREPPRRRVLSRGDGSLGRTVIVRADSALDAVAVAERLNPGYIVEEKGVVRRTSPTRNPANRSDAII
jgi:hypothetical protein